LSAELGFSLRVLHVNHQLRGKESEEDEQFVRELAGSLAVEIDVMQAPVGQAAGNLEQAARDARRSALLSAIGSGSVSQVALGHTLSDQAETVLFRLLRGAGLAGLSGMRCVSDEGLVRPLLFLTREEVRAWASHQQLRWREDSSNADRRFRRNFLRNEVLPQVKASLNPGVETVLARTAITAQTEEDYWEQLVKGVFAEFAQGGQGELLCDVKLLNRLHLAVQRRVIRRAFKIVKGDLRLIDISHVEAVLNICRSYEGHDRVQVPGIDALRVARPAAGTARARHYHLAVVPNQEIELPFQAGKIWLRSIEPRSPEGQNCANFINVKDRSEIVNLDREALGGEIALGQLIVRNWKPGDEYRPTGYRGVKKVKELFQEHRVLLWERRHWPVLDLNGEIVWARGFGPAAKFQMEQDYCRTVSLTYVAPLNRMPQSNV
jgi:tRNA(Ile)-lysidine synthase